MEYVDFEVISLEELNEELAYEFDEESFDDELEELEAQEILVLASIFENEA